MVPYRTAEEANKILTFHTINNHIPNAIACSRNGGMSSAS